MTPPWGKARFKLFFGARGTVVRVTTVQSSGSAERDRQCIAYCWHRTVPLRKKGVRTNAQWFILDIDAHAVLDVSPQ
ncbi:hypothetical protein [Paraburkholderia adhaesiva]|uniref:hypothetical protein n=1 Tax=Paraburkholderia adhaesiva TaxID=2883244 RepID=UPI001F1800F4|nr:hypothetical protein [Paraburkholderia adhaesiva]